METKTTKRLLWSLGACAFLAAGLLLYSPHQAQAEIKGSAHDFSPLGWSGGEICKPCHTPHFANTTVPDAPLWNHGVTNATFTVYSSPTLQASVGQPGGVSKLCLSCHDGTVAVDSFGGTMGSVMIGNRSNVGTELGDDHPVSFTYDAVLATNDGELYDPTSATTALGGTVQEDLLLDDKMECSSCHDVHNKYPNPKLLVIDNVGSSLCLTCHNK